MLYQANARVRRAAVTVAGRIACSIAADAPRSRPMPFTMPRNAANVMTTTDDAIATATPPAAASTASTTSERRRPARSAAIVVSRVAVAPPARPAVTTTPIAAGSRPSLAR